MIHRDSSFVLSPPTLLLLCSIYPTRSLGFFASSARPSPSNVEDRTPCLSSLSCCLVIHPRSRRPIARVSPSRPILSRLPRPPRRFALDGDLWIRTATVYTYDSWISLKLLPSWAHPPTRNLNKAFLRTTSLSRRDATSGESGLCDYWRLRSCLTAEATPDGDLDPPERPLWLSRTRRF